MGSHRQPCCGSLWYFKIAQANAAKRGMQPELNPVPFLCFHRAPVELIRSSVAQGLLRHGGTAAEHVRCVWEVSSSVSWHLPDKGLQVMEKQTFARDLGKWLPAPPV